MIIAARQARTANTCAPLQERAATATGRIRDLFRPAMRYWAHARSTQQMSGAVSAVLDASSNGTLIDQATASKQPIAASTANIKSWVFDGLNDCLQTASIDFSAIAAATVAIVHRAGSTAGGVIHEMSVNQNLVFDGWGTYQNDFAGNRISTGGQVGVGAAYQYREWVAATSTWRAVVCPWDRAAAGAAELSVYVNGAQQTAFTSSFTANATTNFGNYQHFIGSRNNGTSYASNCSLASVLVLQVALDDTAAVTLSTLLRQAAGVP